MVTTKEAVEEIVNLPEKIILQCIKATSFPEGIEKAHEQLKELLSSESHYSVYGISRPDKNGVIEYLAATNAVLRSSELEELTLYAGSYRARIVGKWKDNALAIRETFNELINFPDVHPQGYCLEEYRSDEMRCLVPLKMAMNLSNKNLIEDIESAFSDFRKSIDVFDDETYNRVPFAGSWTPGQVVDHIIKSIRHLPSRKTMAANRFFDEHEKSIKDTFLNFNIKMESPADIIPDNKLFDRNDQLHKLEKIEQAHRDTASNGDVAALCLDFEFPQEGFLTTYEWLKFFVFHLQRHTHQLAKIAQKEGVPPS